MNLRLILPAAAALIAASCTPYVEPPPESPVDPAQRKPTPEEQQKVREQREALKKEAEGDRTPEKEKQSEGGGQSSQVAERKQEGNTGGTTESAPAPREIPVARPVPGKPGFVFSPFNNKLIDVKGFPPGALVADPTYPASEKKHFRVP